MRTDGAPPLSVSLLLTWAARIEPVAKVEAGSRSAAPSDEDARQRRDRDAERPPPRALSAGHLRIELDAESGRFIQTLTDPSTDEVLRRFPHESQISFARAARAYAIAQQQR
jgi:hypothetical protein